MPPRALHGYNLPTLDKHKPFPENPQSMRQGDVRSPAGRLLLVWVRCRQPKDLEQDPQGSRQLASEGIGASVTTGAREWRLCGRQNLLETRNWAKLVL